MANYDPSKKPMLSKVKIGEQYYWLKDAAAREIIDIIYGDYLKAADKTELLNKIAEKVAISDYNTKMAALDAKDAEIAQDLQDEIDARVEDVADLQEQIDEIEAGLVKVKSGEKILGLDETTKELSTTLSINYDSENRKVQLKGISGTLVSEFDASVFIKDGMLWGEKAFVATGTSETVSITKGSITQTHEFTGLTKKHQYLALCFTDGAVPTPTYSWDIVDLQDLVDVYTGGNGIDITSNVVSIKRDSSSEGFLTVGENGLKLSGVQTAITTAVGIEQDRASAVEEGLDSDIKAVASDLADEVSRAKDAEEDLQSSIDGLDGRLTTAEGEIDALQADSHTHANKAELDKIESGDKAKWDKAVGDLAAEVTRAKAAEQANATAISNEASARETADNSLQLGIDGLNSDLSDEITRAEAAEEALDGRLDVIEGKETGWDAKLDNVKLNGEFVNVKSDVTGKGNYVDLGTIATSEELDELEERVEAAEGDIDQLQSDIQNLEVKGQTISGVKASGTSTGELTGSLNYDSTPLSSSGTFTATGEVGVTLSGNTFNAITAVGSMPEYTKENITGGKTAVIDTTKFNGGSVATYSHNGFSGGSLGDPTKSQFAVEGLVASVDEEAKEGDDNFECLVFTAATKSNAVTEQGLFTAAVYGTDTFDGGSVASLGTGFYTAGSDVVYTPSTWKDGVAPTMASQTVAVADTSFTGTANQPINVSGNYDKANLGTVAFSGKAIELSVGNIVVTDKDVTKKA